MEPTNITQKSRRGFASMSVEERKAIASMGGKAAHASGLAHRFDSREGMEAGRKGGENRRFRAAMRKATPIVEQKAESA